MKKNLITVIVLIFIQLSLFPTGRNDDIYPTTLSLWTDESGDQLLWLEKLAESFSTENKKITIEILSKKTDSLREDFMTTAIAGIAPDLLLTGSEYTGLYAEYGLLQSVEEFTDIQQFIGPSIINNTPLTIPVSIGNHLMLMINKKYIDSFPEDTDQFISLAKKATNRNISGLVYNLNDAMWLIPWIGGFKGELFSSDGITPTLNTPAMINSLAFVRDLKFKHNIVPRNTEDISADTLFKEQKAAMIISGDWAINTYRKILDDDLVIGRLPRNSITGAYPSPYTSGVYFLIPEALPLEKESAVKAFIAFATSEKSQVNQLEKLARLPGRVSVMSDPGITTDRLIQGSLSQWELGTPMPTQSELIKILNAINSQLPSVMDGSRTPEEAAKLMQITAERDLETK